MENRESGAPDRESKESVNKFNLLTNFEETVAAMGEVEGESWLIDDQRNKGELTTRKAVEHLERIFSDGPIEGEVVVFQIYGAGGVSRWNVMGNGEVRFSRFHNREGAEKAEALGFKIFE